MTVELLSITPDAEKIIEIAGRTSYQSFGKQTPESYKKFVQMLVKRGHESVLEHAYATFRIRGSRAFTHQLVRHRIASYTQKSQRYVNEENFNYIEPESIKNNLEAHKIFTKFMDNAKAVYTELQKAGIKNEDARYVLPNAIETEIIMTANFREWRHIIELRGKPDAQWEIRKIVIEILKILKNYAPDVFFDFEIDEEKGIIMKNVKL